MNTELDVSGVFGSLRLFRSLARRPLRMNLVTSMSVLKLVKST